MLEQTTQDLRKFFLLAFTREMIKNTKTEAIYELLERLKNQQKLEKEKIRKIERTATAKIKIPLIGANIPQRRIPMVLRIPEPQIPPHLRYLRPYAIEMELDLEKLNPLLNDSSVIEIECQGSETNVIVRGQMGQKQTGIILTEEEINNIINTIAIESKMPKEEGLFHSVIGKIIFSAIISEHGSRFIIKKIVR